MSSLISTQLKRIKLLCNAAVIRTTDNFRVCNNLVKNGEIFLPAVAPLTFY